MTQCPQFRAALRKTFLALQGCVLLGCCQDAFAQAPDVPVYRQGRRETEYEDKIRQAAQKLFATGAVVKLAAVNEQLKRTSCRLELPAPRTAKLSSRELCASARGSHLRVGWAYLCTKCDEWHVNLAGGYLLTADGAVATCYHVVQPDSSIKDGCLIAADEDAQLYAVTEVLAAHRHSDACILRVHAPPLRPLPLSTNVWPGDLPIVTATRWITGGTLAPGL